MSEFLTDPSILTKDKLKSALVANNVALPNGDQRKGVYVDLYLRNLTSQNKKSSPPDAFSSDEDLDSMISNKSRSGRKATRKTDRLSPEELDVTDLTDEGLREQLLKYGVCVGPIVASTRKVYEKRLQKFLEQGPSDVTPPHPDDHVHSSPPHLDHAHSALLHSEHAHTDSSHNGTTYTDQYSDTEGEMTAVPEPEPVPVVERPVRSRGKPFVTPRTLSSQHRIEKLSYVEQTPKMAERNVLKEMFPNESLSTPTAVSVSCRPPIKGAAGRPLPDAWLDDLRPRLTELRQTSASYTESRSAPPVAATPFPASRPTTPPVGQATARRRIPVWVRLLLLSAVAAFLLLVYQAMETNEMGPFGQRANSALHSTSK